MIIKICSEIRKTKERLYYVAEDYPDIGVLSLN